MTAALEVRGVRTKFELREVGSTLKLTGYASTSETPYPVGAFTETMARGAFARTLAASPDVVLLISHAGLPLARTRSRTLRLSEDSTGLHVEAGLDPSDPDVKSLAPKMRRGDLTEMSFGFRVPRGGDEWSDDYSRRRVHEVDLHKGDVSVVAYGANDTTSVELASRGLAPALVRQQARARRGMSLDLARALNLAGRAADYGVARKRAKRIPLEEARAVAYASELRGRSYRRG